MQLAELMDVEAVGQRLASLRVSDGDGRIAAGFVASAQALAKAAVRREAAAFFVPGRIEVLGKHTDYAGGRSIVAATSRGFALLATPRVDGMIHMTDAASGEQSAWDFASPGTTPSGHWSQYPRTVARRIARNFAPPLYGADIAFCSNLPPASGMSSSSALIVATFLALARLNDLQQRPEYRRAISGGEALADYLGAVENGESFGPLAGDRGVGTFGGSEDHVAILCSQPGFVRQYRFCPVRLERAIPLPPENCFVIATSGIAAEKTGAAQQAYNRASLLAAEAARVWRKSTGRQDRDLASALSAGPDSIPSIREALCAQIDGTFSVADLVCRFEHFLAESEQIVPAAGDALAGGDLERFGTLVDRSQGLGESLLGNQVPETVFLAREARNLGAVAASSFGAGFGGSVWAMVGRDVAEEFSAIWRHTYAARYPQHASTARFFVSEAGPGAVELGNAERDF